MRRNGIRCLAVLLFTGLVPPAPGQPAATRVATYPAPYERRTPALRAEMLKEGGTKESEEAVAKGLLWLALHQARDGHWSLDKFNLHARDDLNSVAYKPENATGQASTSNDTAATAFGVLPFLAAGVTHKTTQGELSKYAPTVQRGLSALLRMQQPKDGAFPGGMYAHALATLTICEAYGMSRDLALKRPAEVALAYLVRAQHTGGGWRYTPGQSGDTSVTGYVVLALKAGQAARFPVPAAVMTRADQWIATTARAQDGGYGYTNNSPTPTMTAAGMLCRLQAGGAARKDDLKKDAEQLAKLSRGRESQIYHAFWATQAFYHLGGETWKDWNETFRDKLIALQDQDGSWSLRSDPYVPRGGRVMLTSMAVMNLQVYYRLEPVVPRAKEDDNPDK